MANALEITLHDLGAETTEDSGTSVDLGETRSAVSLRLNVLENEDEFTLIIETSPDETTWRSVSETTANVTSAPQRILLDGLDRYLRVSWEPTTSVTFSLEGEAHTLYATRSDLTLGELPEKAMRNLGDDVIIQALLDASSDAEDALAASNSLPLASWPTSLSRRCASIAMYQIMRARGFRPESFDELIVKAHDDAQKWLKDVAAGRIRPPGLNPATRLGPQSSSGNPNAPTRYKRRFSDNWGDYS